MRTLLALSVTLVSLGMVPGQSQTLVSGGSSRGQLALGLGPTEEALEIYAELTSRTVLRPGELRRLTGSIKPDLPADTNAAIAHIVSALAECEIQVVPDGERFARVLPINKVDTLTAGWLSQIKTPPATLSPSSNDFAVNFFRVSLDEILDFYSELRGRTTLRSSTLSGSVFILRSQGGLTAEEMVYALTVVLAMNGLAVVDDGAHFVQVVPVEAASQVKLGAPEPDPGAPLLDPKRLPSTSDPGILARGAQPGRVSIRDRLTMLYMKYVGAPPALLADPSRDADRLVEFYAELTGRKAVASERVGRTTLPFEIKTPLTEKEVLYAIETTLTLNDLVIIQVDEQSIRAGHVSDPPRPGGGHP